MIAVWPQGATAAMAGLVLGSFAVTAGLRFARNELALGGRSRCDGCGEALGFKDTIPVVSYLRQAGVCRGCRTRIDPLHLVGELAGAGVVLGAFALAPLDRAALLSLIGLSLIAAAATDIKAQRLPDLTSGLIAAAGLGLAALDGAAAVTAGLAASAIAAALLLLIREAGRRRRGDAGLGLGDVKLIAALALWLGAATPVLVVGAALLGLALAPLLRDPAGRLPFGPMIALSAWTVGSCMEVGYTPWAL